MKHFIAAAGSGLIFLCAAFSATADPRDSVERGQRLEDTSVTAQRRTTAATSRTDTAPQRATTLARHAATSERATIAAAPATEIS
jgi:hypothetical protein